MVQMHLRFSKAPAAMVEERVQVLLGVLLHREEVGVLEGGAVRVPEPPKSLDPVNPCTKPCHPLRDQCPPPAGLEVVGDGHEKMCIMPGMAVSEASS